MSYSELNLATTDESKLRENIHIVSGIDTLYVQLVVTKDSYIPFYQHIILNNKLECVEFEFLGMNKQYHIYRLYQVGKTYSYNNSVPAYLPYSRILFKNLNPNDGLEFVFLQLEGVAIHKFGLINTYNYVKNKLSLLGLEIVGSKVSRVDFNHFVEGFDFGEPYFLSLENFHTQGSSIERKFIKYGKVETYYFGKQLKIYDKHKELLEKMDAIVSVKNTAIRQRFEEKYGYVPNMYPLWNVEFSLKREELRSYGIDTFEDVLKYQKSVHKDLLVRRFRLLEEPVKDFARKDRVNTHPIWKLLIENIDSLEKQRETKRFTKSYHHIFNEDSLIRSMDRFLKDRGLYYSDYMREEILSWQAKLRKWKEL